jgi:hypothetical protein
MAWRFLTVLLVLGFTLTWAPAADTSAGRDQRKGDKNHKNQTTGKNRADVKATSPLFGPRDRDIIAGYYRNRASNLPPGLAKRGGNLPPGLERQLQRDGTLPPGLQERLELFPVELNRRLPPLPPGYVRGVIDGSAIVVSRQTWTIVDVINGVLSPQM